MDIFEEITPNPSSTLVLVVIALNLTASTTGNRLRERYKSLEN